MKPVCLRDPYVGGMGGEARVLQEPCVAGPLVCTACARACGNSVLLILLGVWAVGTFGRISEFRAAEVIEAQCTYGPLNDMGRCKQSTCDPRRRFGGMGLAVSLPGVEDRTLMSYPGLRGSTAAQQHMTQDKHT